jgi:hypothetical protein
LRQLGKKAFCAFFQIDWNKMSLRLYAWILRYVKTVDREKEKRFEE